MSEVKRLNFTISQFESVVPYASEHGQYVRYTDYAKLAAEAQALREEVAELRARVVVTPALRDVSASVDPEYRASATGYNLACADMESLNGLTVSEGLLRRIAAPVNNQDELDAVHEARIELRALLNQDKENGNG